MFDELLTSDISPPLGKSIPDVVQTKSSQCAESFSFIHKNPIEIHAVSHNSPNAVFFHLHHKNHIRRKETSWTAPALFFA